MCLPCSMTFGPKEDTNTLYWVIKGTIAFYEQHFGIHLKSLLNVLMWDATLAGRAAHSLAVPGVGYARDLRHQVAKAKETAKTKCSGEKDTRGVACWLVIGSLIFSAFNLWTLELFHDHWEQVHARLIVMGQSELVKWVNEYVLFWNSKAAKWDAHWRSALMSDRSPGESTYLPQVLESLHDTIKDATPRTIRLKEPSTAIRKLTSATDAVARSRDWIAPATGPIASQKWVFTQRLDEEMAHTSCMVCSFFSLR